MKQLAQLVLLLSLLVQTVPQASATNATVCPPNWLVFGSSCYLAVHGAGKSFLEARANCQSMNADLLWLESQEELDWAVASDRFGIKNNWDQCGSGCGNLHSAWIGLHRAGADLSNLTTLDEWVWLRDGSSISLRFSWYFQHPKSSPNDFIALTDSTSTARFRTEPKAQKLFSICKMDPKVNPGSCPTVDWLLHNGFCYLLVKGTSGRTVTEAVADCQSRDPSAHLLWVTSEAEQSWIIEYHARNWKLRDDYIDQCQDCRPDGHAAWTGLYRDTQDNELKWLRDNSRVSVNIKWFGAPSPSPMDHGYLLDTSSTLYWRTFEPSAKHYHFCKSPVRMATTVEPTTEAETTVEPTTEVETTVEPTTEAETTVKPTTEAETTVEPTTEAETTVELTTEAETTVEPTTEAETTVEPTTEAETTVEPTTDAETTVKPTTEAETTVEPTTEAETTVEPTTEADTTVNTTAEAETTVESTTESNIEPTADKLTTEQATETATETMEVETAKSSITNRPSEKQQTSDEPTSTNGDLGTESAQTISERTATTETATSPARWLTTRIPTITPEQPLCPSTEWVANPGGSGCFLLVKGASGLTFRQARADCQRRHPSGDLMRPDAGPEELLWLLSRPDGWGIGAGWAACRDCGDVPAAWVGMARGQVDAEFRWLGHRGTHGSESSLDFEWWPNHPKRPPADFVAVSDLQFGAADNDSQPSPPLRRRSEPDGQKLWHFCRANPTAAVTSSAGAPGTSPTPQPIDLWEKFLAHGGLVLIGVLPPLLAILGVLVYFACLRGPTRVSPTSGNTSAGGLDPTETEESV